MAGEVVSRRAASPGAIITGGAAAGIIGGIVMAMFEMMYTGMTSGNFMMPLRLMGATFAGPHALVGGMGVLMWGMIVHLMTSAVLGIVFAWVVGPNFSGGAAVGLGVGYGIVVMLVMTFLVVPWANPTMSARIPMMMFAWVIGHILYGMCLGLAPRFVARSEGMLLD